MLHEEYARIAKSLDNVTGQQAEQIMAPVLDKLRAVTSAMLVDIWVREPGRDGVDVLTPYLRRKDRDVPDTQFVALTKEAKGLLVWVAENLKPVLIDIEEHAAHAINRLTGQPIDGRYIESVYDRTRAFIAVPFNYRGHFGILTVESDAPRSLNDFHVELMKTLTEPTGILVWKAGVSETIRKQTNEAIDEFRSLVSDFAPPLNRVRTGFIARPFNPQFECISDALEAAFRKEGVRVATYCPAADSKLVVSEMLAQISSAHFGIADITSLNKNVLVELGAMIALKKKFIILRAKSDDGTVPFNLAGYDCYRYAIDNARIGIMDAASDPQSLDQFVHDFISQQLLRDSLFRNAETVH